MERIGEKAERHVDQPWPRRLAWPIVAGMAMGVSPWLDEAVAAWVAQPVSSGQLKATLASLRCWGEAPTILIVCAALFLGTRGGWRIPIGVMVGALLVGVIVSSVKPIFGRARPEEVASRGLTGGWHATSEHNSSMPSGHVATAFAFARGVSIAYPAVQPVCLLAAGGTALSRMRDQRHYLSDCVVGGILGWTVAGWVASQIIARRPRREEECSHVPMGAMIVRQAG